MDDATQKPATSARIYDYYLGGVHHFPADRDAAEQVAAVYPFVPATARANRAFLRRAVGTLVDLGIRQFLDIGSGIPTSGNVHEIAQARVPDARVVYVDIDPVAVAESLELLEGNRFAAVIRADLREPRAILAHPAVRRLLDFTAPIGLLLAAVLHFVPEDDEAYGAVEYLVHALPSGSYLAVSHVASESFLPVTEASPPQEDVYRSRTATPGTVRTRADVARFFTGLELIEPGLVWADEWRPDPDHEVPETMARYGGGIWAAVGRKPD
jgi:trans-aconitate methyltransferase